MILVFANSIYPSHVGVDHGALAQHCFIKSTQLEANVGTFYESKYIESRYLLEP